MLARNVVAYDGEVLSGVREVVDEDDGAVDALDIGDHPEDVVLPRVLVGVLGEEGVHALDGELQGEVLAVGGALEEDVAVAAALDAAHLPRRGSATRRAASWRRPPRPRPRRGTCRPVGSAAARTTRR